jgi:hypothetical protein
MDMSFEINFYKVCFHVLFPLCAPLGHSEDVQLVYNIVTCMVAHVTNKRTSALVDWIYYHFSYTRTLNYNYIPAIQRYR